MSNKVSELEILGDVDCFEKFGRGQGNEISVTRAIEIMEPLLSLVKLLSEEQEK